MLCITAVGFVVKNPLCVESGVIGYYYALAMKANAVRFCMKVAAKILVILLLASTGRAAETNGNYYSDEEYKKLQPLAAPSNFYPDGNSGQLELLIMCIDRGDVVVLDRLLKAVPNFANVVEHGSRS